MNRDKHNGLLTRIQNYMMSYSGKTLINYFYSWGAAIVILGTLFKLTHLPGANLMLYIGMGTEVLVFIISGFDRPTKTYRWESVFPNLEIAGRAPKKPDPGEAGAGETAGLPESVVQGMAGGEAADQQIEARRVAQRSPFRQLSLTEENVRQIAEVIGNRGVGDHAEHLLNERRSGIEFEDALGLRDRLVEGAHDALHVRTDAIFVRHKAAGTVGQSLGKAHSPIRKCS